MSTIFKSINWMQGMSVSSSHFIATENYIMERLMKNTELLQDKYAYGLLPSIDEEPQMQLSVVGKGAGTRLVLYSYQGITQGGYYIDLNASDESVNCICEDNGERADEGWDVILSVLPFERRPCGEPDMKEVPPRYPFVDPSYKLSIVARDKNSVNHYGPFDVVVGLLRKKDGEFRLDGNYIPPSLSMSATTDLANYMRSFSQIISSIKNALDLILTKAFAQSANKSDVLENVVIICKEIQRSLASMYFHWHNYGMAMSPYKVTEIISGLANAILTSLTFMSKANKEEVLKYFYEWNGVSPSAFEQIMDEVVSLEFNQNRISLSMLSIDSMLKMLEELMVSLSRLDYVGQHKESMVISVSSTKEETNQGKKSSWLL